MPRLYAMRRPENVREKGSEAVRTNFAAHLYSKPFAKLARTLREHRDGILNAIRLGLSNSRLEGLASRIRLISHRSFGFHSAEPLIALIHLCCGRITVSLPT